MLIVSAPRYLLFFVLVVLFNSCKQREEKPERREPKSVKSAVNGIEEKRSLVNTDKSPMDMIYFPPDYPVLKMSGKIKGLPVARVIYSRPIKDGRPIFGNVVKYGSYWRLGANESTEIEFFEDVNISGKKVKKGRYIMYCIPYHDKWTIRLNNDLYTWGLKIHASGDLYSFDIPVEKMNIHFEVFTMDFAESKDGAELIMVWDNIRAVLPFSYKNKGV